VPPGRTDLLVRHHNDYGLPMYTTENGGASRLRFARRARGRSRADRPPGRLSTA